MLKFKKKIWSTLISFSSRKSRGIKMMSSQYDLLIIMIYLQMVWVDIVDWYVLKWNEVWCSQFDGNVCGRECWPYSLPSNCDASWLDVVTITRSISLDTQVTWYNIIIHWDILRISCVMKLLESSDYRASTYLLYLFYILFWCYWYEQRHLDASLPSRKS